MKVANAPWGSVPDMISIDSLTAFLDPWSISSGVLKVQKLRVVKPIIVLERNKDRIGNWKFASTDPPSPEHFASGPQDRNKFPTLLEFAIEDGLQGKENR